MNFVQIFGSRAVAVSVVLSMGLLLSSCESKVEDNAKQASGTGVSVEVGSAVESQTSAVSATPKIGAYILKSGSEEASTKAFEQGAQLAVSSNPASTFELKFFDAAEGSSPESAALKSLVEKEKAPAVIYWTTDDISFVAPYLSQSDAVGIVAEEVTKKVIRLGANIFGFGYSTESTFKQMAKFAGSTLKSYRFAVISAADARYDVQRKAFIEESKSLGNTIVFDEAVDAASADFNALIARAEKEKCDTIFAVLPFSALVQFIKTVRASKFKGKLLVGDRLFASELAALGQDAEGIYMAQAWSDDADFKTLYSTKYGNTPDGVTLGIAALGFDLVKCIQGMNAPLDAYSIKHSFLAQSCEGLTGKTQFSGERMAQRRKQILTVKNGQFVLAE